LSGTERFDDGASKVIELAPFPGLISNRLSISELVAPGGISLGNVTQEPAFKVPESEMAATVASLVK
jgi:hypothetical protein